MFNPFKKNHKATDMTTPENSTASSPSADQPIDSEPRVDAAAAPEAAAAAPLSEQDFLAQRLSELEAKHTEVSDAYLRAKAEVENARRRADEEVSKARKFAVEAFAESLLPVKDSLEAAIAMPDAKVEAVLEGVHGPLVVLRSVLHAPPGVGQVPVRA